MMSLFHSMNIHSTSTSKMSHTILSLFECLIDYIGELPERVHPQLVPELFLRIWSNFATPVSQIDTSQLVSRM